MPKIKHVAIDPAGEKHTRHSSTKSYTHAVLARLSLEHDVAQTRRPTMNHEISNFEYYLAFANGTSRWLAKPGDHTAEIERSRKVIEGCTTAQDYVAKMRSEELASIRAREASGWYTSWHVEGWCSRADLAAKLHTSVASKPWFTEAKIVEVTQG